MGGKRSKSAGTAFEYRVRNWFKEKRPGWDAERNPLSGASDQISESVGKHDVRAWNAEGIFLQIEAKKRTRVKDPKKRHQIEVLWEWIEKVEFDKDELLVVGFDRSEMFAMIETSRFFQILGRDYPITYTKDNTFSGKKQFVFKQSYLDGIDFYHLLWESYETEYTILRLDRFVTLRETADLHDELTPEDTIKRCMNINDLKTFEEANLADLSYKQKKLLYQKFEQLESDSFISPIAMADSQFWLDDEAFICICPHCEKEIRKKDFTEEEG